MFSCPCSDLTAAKTNNDTPQKRRGRRGGSNTRTTRRHDVVTFWVQMIEGQCKIGCSSSVSWEPTCESEDDPPQVDTSITLWNGMREELQKFLKDRLKAAKKINGRETGQAAQHSLLRLLGLVPHLEVLRLNHQYNRGGERIIIQIPSVLQRQKSPLCNRNNNHNSHRSNSNSHRNSRSNSHCSS